MNKHWRKVLVFVLFALALAACGGDGEDVASDSAEEEAIVEESTTTTAPETTTTTTTAAPTTTAPSTTEAPAAGAPSAATSAGVAAFGSAILNPSNIEGVGDAETACVSDRLDGVDTAVGFEGLEVDDQVRSIEAGLDCAGEALRPVFLASFTSNGGADTNLLDAIGAEAGDCFFDGIAVDDADQANRISALVYANAEQPAPEAAVAPGASLLADCADFNVIFTALAGGDPTLQAGIDQTCVDETFDRDAAVDLYSMLLAEPAALDGAEVPESLNGLFACFNIGELIAQQFGGTDVISEESISCLNEVFQSPEVVGGLIGGGGGDLPPEVLTGLFGCLDSEALAGLVGGN